MWLLITPTGELIYLKSNVPVSIGRKKSDILLSHDASVSKLHASVVVKSHRNVMIGKPTSSCILKDEGSKYGTYISKNGTFEKVITNIHLKDKDVIRIGLQREIFTVKYIPIISMTSALQDNEKDKLIEIMNVIDGIVTTDWNQYCTHLTVVKPKLTQKVAVSLAACIPIVSIDYWDAVKCIIEKGDPFPKTDKFIPKINEQYISKISTSLAPNYERKTLFADLTFNFFSIKQYELYKTMIQLAGGTPVLYNPNNEKNNTFECNFIFVHYSLTDSTQLSEDIIQGYNYICKQLDARRCRTIPESEIPLAILHCSTERYCNSKFNFGNCLKRREEPNHNLPETLVIDTQDQDIVMVEDIAGKQNSCYNKRTNYVTETLENNVDTSIQGNAMSQENLHCLKELTPQREQTSLKKLFVPETIEFADSSERNTDCHMEQNSNCDSFKANINNNLKETFTSIGATFGEKHTAILSNEYQEETSYAKEIFSSEVQICIPETIDDNYSNLSGNCNKMSTILDSSTAIKNFSKENDLNDPETIDDNYSDFSENCNKMSTILGSSIAIKNFSKENDLNDTIIRKETRKAGNDMLIITENVSKAEVIKNIQLPKTQKEVERDKNRISTFSSDVKLLKEIDNKNNSSISYKRTRESLPGKTFKKAYVKIPERRKRLMDLTTGN